MYASKRDNKTDAGARDENYHMQRRSPKLRRPLPLLRSHWAAQISQEYHWPRHCICHSQVRVIIRGPKSALWYYRQKFGRIFSSDQKRWTYIGFPRTEFWSFMQITISEETGISQQLPKTSAPQNHVHDMQLCTQDAQSYGSTSKNNR